MLILSPRARKWAGALFLFLVLVGMVWPVKTLQITDSETENLYFRLPAREGAVLRLSWIHSVEQTPWVEEYRIKDGRFSLEEVRVKSFGAGVEMDADQVSHQGGWVVMRGFDRSEAFLSFRYSTHAQYRMEVDGHELPLEQRVGHHHPLTVYIQTQPRIWTMIAGGGVF